MALNLIMINYLQNYQYVMEYDTNAEVDPKIIENVFKEAIRTTPSKQNMMPYKVHVIGPEHLKIKQAISKKTRKKQDNENDDKAKDVRSTTYQTDNICTAPYVLMFTQRIETQPSEIYRNLMSKGFYFEQTDLKNPNNAQTVSIIETGMFAYAISNLFLQHKLNVSYTQCFDPELENWSESEFSFLEMPVWLIMTVGKGKIYRRQHYPYLTPDIDHKPEWDRIINFIK